MACVADISDVEERMSRFAAHAGGQIPIDKREGGSRPRDGPAQQVLCRDFSRQGPSDD